MDKLYYDRASKRFYVKELNTEKCGDILVVTDEQYVDVTDEIVELFQEHIDKCYVFDTTTSLRPQPKRDCKDCAMFLNGKCTKPHWEPSGEQIRTLDIVVSDYRHACTKDSDKKAEILKSLLEQLKKLI